MRARRPPGAVAGQGLCLLLRWHRLQRLDPGAYKLAGLVSRSRSRSAACTGGARTVSLSPPAANPACLAGRGDRLCLLDPARRGYPSHRPFGQPLGSLPDWRGAEFPSSGAERLGLPPRNRSIQSATWPAWWLSSVQTAGPCGPISPAAPSRTRRPWGAWLRGRRQGRSPVPMPLIGEGGRALGLASYLAHRPRRGQHGRWLAALLAGPAAVAAGDGGHGADDGQCLCPGDTGATSGSATR